MEFTEVDRFRSFRAFVGDTALFGSRRPRSALNRNRDGLPFWQLFSGCNSGELSAPSRVYLRSFGTAYGVGIVAQPTQNSSTAPYQLVYFMHVLAHSLGMHHETLCPEADHPCRSIGLDAVVPNMSVGVLLPQNTGISHIDGRMQFSEFSREAVCRSISNQMCTWLATGMVACRRCPAACSAAFCADGAASEDSGLALSHDKCQAYCAVPSGNSGGSGNALRRCGRGASYQMGDSVDCTQCGPADPAVALCENECSQSCGHGACRAGDASLGGAPLVNGWCTEICSADTDPLIAAPLTAAQTCGVTEAYQIGLFHVCKGCKRYAHTLGSATRTVSGGRCELPFSHNGRQYQSCARVLPVCADKTSPEAFTTGRTLCDDGSKPTLSNAWCLTAGGSAEDCLCTASGGTIPMGQQGPLADATCQFPFTYGGETYNSCIPLGRRAPWCYTDQASGTWGYCSAGCPLACWGVTGDGHPQPFGAYRCQFPFLDDKGAVHHTCALDSDHFGGLRPWCRVVNDSLGSVACSPTCQWALLSPAD